MSQIGLSTLLGRFPSQRFFLEHWPRTLLVQHGSPRRLKGLTDAPELRDVEALTALPARQWLVQSSRFQNRFGNVPVSGNAAAEFFHTGHTIYAVEPEIRSAPFLRWLAGLERDLELSTGLILPSVFLSKPGPGSRMHFDAQESFVVQVRGRKRWWLAPNADVQFPAENYIAGDEVSESLAVQLDRPLARRMPDDAVSVVLEPGSIMFVPRGTWHATETLEESWHLDLMLPLPTWATRWRRVWQSTSMQVRTGASQCSRWRRSTRGWPCSPPSCRPHHRPGPRDPRRREHAQPGLAHVEAVLLELHRNGAPRGRRVTFEPRKQPLRCQPAPLRAEALVLSEWRLGEPDTRRERKDEGRSRRPKATWRGATQAREELQHRGDGAGRDVEQRRVTSAEGIGIVHHLAVEAGATKRGLVEEPMQQHGRE